MEGALKVVHVVRQFSPSVGGLEGAVLNLCIALRDEGVDATVVTLDRISKGVAEPLAKTDSINGVPVRRIPFSGSFRYPLAPAVLREVKDADVIHVHAVDFFFDFLAVTKAVHGKPMVASTHGGYFHTAFAQTLKRIYFQTATRAAMRAYNIVCASSQSDFELFQGIEAGNLRLLENGADTEKWRNLAATTPARHLLYVGRFSSNKQLDLLFPILAGLRRLHPDWWLTIAGRPWDVTTEHLAAQARAAGVSDAVHLLDSPSDAAIADVIKSASYMTSSSRHEGFGISIVEGMSAGLVPVLNRIPPFEALIAKAGCGCLINVAEAEPAATNIEAFHHVAVPHWGQMREACMAASASFSWSAAAQLALTFYTEVGGSR